MTRVARQSSEGSSETLETEKPSGEPWFRKPCCQWLPRSYLLVFVINATATVLLWPVDARRSDHQHDFPCSFRMRVFFFGLMLSSFGAGCVAAFLVRRAEASDHTKRACGYAIVNWIQSMSGAIGMDSPGWAYCSYGVIPGAVLGGAAWYSALAFFRLLYLVASVWMQTLIASRLDLLEQSSNRSYRSGCFRKLMWAKVFGAAVALLPLAGMVYFIQ